MLVLTMRKTTCWYDLQQLLGTTNNTTDTIWKKLEQTTNIAPPFASIHNLNNSNAPIIARLVPIGKHKMNFGALYLAQGQNQIVCQVCTTDEKTPHMSYLYHWRVFYKYRFIPCNSYNDNTVKTLSIDPSRFSYVELVLDDSLLLCSVDVPILSFPTSSDLDQLSDKIIGRVVALSPCFTQQHNDTTEVAFLVKLSTRTHGTITIMFTDRIHDTLVCYHHFLSVNESFVLTNICEMTFTVDKTTSTDIMYVASANTCIYPYSSDTSDLGIYYQGTITGTSQWMVNASLELDNQIQLYMIGYTSSTFGRSLRIGTRICVYNAHTPVTNMLVCCMYSTVRILSFSDNNVPYQPLITKYLPLYYYAQSRLPTIKPHYLLYEQLLYHCSTKFDMDSNTLNNGQYIHDIMRNYYEYHDHDHYFPMAKRFVYEQFVNHTRDCMACIPRDDVPDISNIVTLATLVQDITSKQIDHPLPYPAVYPSAVLDYILLVSFRSTNCYDSSGEIPIQFLLDHVQDDNFDIKPHDVYHLTDYRIVLDIIDNKPSCYIQVFSMQRLFEVDTRDDEIDWKTVDIVHVYPMSNGWFTIEHSSGTIKSNRYGLYQRLLHDLNQFIHGQLILQVPMHTRVIDSSTSVRVITQNISVPSLLSVSQVRKQCTLSLRGLLVHIKRIPEQATHVVYLLRLRDEQGPDVIDLYLRMPLGTTMVGFIPNSVIVSCYQVVCRQSQSKQYYLTSVDDQSLIAIEKANSNSMNDSQLFNQVETYTLYQLLHNDIQQTVCIQSCTIRQVFEFDEKASLAIDDGTARATLVIRDKHVLQQLLEQDKLVDRFTLYARKINKHNFIDQLRLYGVRCKRNQVWNECLRLL